MDFLEELASRRRFGMKPGLDTIRALCAALGDPEKRFRAIHVAGTNGKGAVCAIVEACLRQASTAEGQAGSKGLKAGRYTSPHLVKLNERFFLDGAPVEDEVLARIAAKVGSVIGSFEHSNFADVTFFEALTAVAFELYAEAKVDFAILECGLGGRLDATNICEPVVSVITKIGLDHCDWLGDTVEKIAAEKAGIIKRGVPVVLGRNEPSVIEVIRNAAAAKGAPFHYAPELVDDTEIPADFPLRGSFNRENAVTAFAALKVLHSTILHSSSFILHSSFPPIVWPGRFQQVGSFLIDGAHNPPAARALRDAVLDLQRSTFNVQPLTLIAGFCGDKDVDEVLETLKPLVGRGIAVKTCNPRSLSADETAAKMRAHGISAETAPSLRVALERASGNSQFSILNSQFSTLVCGSLFLAGEALVELGAYPWGAARYDAAEQLRPSK